MPTHPIRRCVVLLAFVVSLAVIAGAPAAATAKDSRYIVVLKDSVAKPGAVANDQADVVDGDVTLVYRSALKGYAATLPSGAVKTLERDPRVDYVAPDRKVDLFAQGTPTGIRRIFAPGNPGLDIDGIDDSRVDVDVAVIDSGIDPEHPDLDAIARTDCVPADGDLEASACVDDEGEDTIGHGTHVAGTIGALDNGIGVVGVAPGARLWSVKVIDEWGYGYESWVIAGVDWVTANASQIEVANMSLGCICTMPALEEAISNSVDAGVVYTAAAGNDAVNVNITSPARNPDVIAVSALADYDGAPGALAASTCDGEEPSIDDRLAVFSNFGSGIDLTAPGVCIRSTWPGGRYATISGTSMAAPHVAGAAAILASSANPSSGEDVAAIRQTIAEAGNLAWTDGSGDGQKEPLLDVSNATTFEPVATRPPVATTEAATNVGEGAATLHATVNPNGEEAEYWFEYGPTTAYGSQVPVPAGMIEAGGEDVRVEASIEGLEATGSYHFRISAANAAGTSTGADVRIVMDPSWSIETTPPTDFDTLEDVACLSAEACLAVGYYDKAGGGDPRPLIETRDASGEWTRQEPALLAGASSPELRGAECLGENLCVAVGSSNHVGTKPLVEVWDGSNFSAYEPPLPKGGKSGSLNEISCPSATACVAVGRFVDSSNTLRPLVATWDGTSGSWAASKWKAQAAPQLYGSTAPTLTGVSCATANDCVAVGADVFSHHKTLEPIAVRWNGFSWYTQNLWTPWEGNGVDVMLTRVSCVAANDCMAVGSAHIPGYAQPLFTRWNGVKWSTTSDIQPEMEGTLKGVTCLEASLCKAVGSAVDGSALAGTWDGSEWTVEESNSGIGDQILKGIECQSASECVAVGGPRSDSGRALTESWDGESWARHESAPTNHEALHGVSCDPDYCVAVGSITDPASGFKKALMEVRNTPGSPWTLESVPLPSGVVNSELSAVACPESNACMAVGTSYDDEPSQYTLLAERWNGESWTRLNVPLPAKAKGGDLSDLSCIAADHCVAVGSYSDSSWVRHELIELWNGSSWSIVAASVPWYLPKPQLTGVSCVAADRCVVVGTYVEGGKERPFSGVLDEAGWEFNPTTFSTSSAAAVILSDVSCSSVSACVAVGVEYDSTQVPLILHGDGVAWTIEYSPEQFATLTGVSCVHVNFCKAVGVSQYGYAVVEGWSGSEWTSYGSDWTPEESNSGNDYAGFAAVECGAPDDCLAVGERQGGTHRALIESWP